MLPQTTPAQELTAVSLAFMDELYDDRAGLLWEPEDGQPDEPEGAAWPRRGERHMVRDSVYYALGLLSRDGLGDRSRAERILSAVLDLQLIHPEAVFHGTFQRAPEEPRPGMWAREWRDYDPNWRDFIGCAFALALIRYEEELPRGLALRMDEALRQAVIGTLQRRVSPAYSNIALMDAYLLFYAGDRLGVPDWRVQGEGLARRIFDLFRENRAFEEFNSPTYYGVDLFALGLWRSFSRSDTLAKLGREMEMALWEDIARFYHAGLRNACGPFDRSYGMDMTRYAALLGEWIWLAAGRMAAPFPDPLRPFDHSADFCLGPAAALVGASVPESVRNSLRAFTGERIVERVITSVPHRAASAWLGEWIMMGGESSGLRVRGSAQYHPFTLHYRAASGAVGWVRLMHGEGADAEVSRASARIESSGSLLFIIRAPGATAADFTRECWKLGEFRVEVGSNAPGFEISERGDGLLELAYTQEESVGIQVSLQVG